MRLLLDTHIALWATFDDTRLPAGARALLSDSGNMAFVSAASIWEIAIKHGIRRAGVPAMPVSGQQALDWFQKAGFHILGVSGVHAAAVDRLPRHHNDPFDRLLVAQALAEPLRLVTADRQLATYGEIVIFV